MPAAELPALAKIKFDIASEAAKLQDWWSSSEDSASWLSTHVAQGVVLRDE